MISIHALREEGDQRRLIRTNRINQFLSTPSARRATRLLSVCLLCVISISIHALREEGDYMPAFYSIEALQFLSTPSARRATCSPFSPSKYTLDFYPRPPRGGRHQQLWQQLRLCTISIHALREEGDISGTGYDIAALLISIHALREEGDPARPTPLPSMTNFYPRPPRGGRLRADKRAFLVAKISIHALREEGDGGCLGRPVRFHCISIHALREEGDPVLRVRLPPGQHFYPRPPRGGRPEADQINLNVALISIHALREEGDVLRCRIRRVYPDFYPRPPRGGRPRAGMDNVQYAQFLSTPSARRATKDTPQGSLLLETFLSTPSARRATCRPCPWSRQGRYFYPRPPRGGRPAALHA